MTFALPVRLLVPAALAAVVIGFLAFSPAGKPESAEAGPVPYVYGDVGCNNGVAGAHEITVDDFFLMAAYIANFQLQITLGPQCPSLGQDVTIDGQGTVKWGDLNCDGNVDALDGLLIMLFLAQVDYQSFCVIALGAAVALLTGTADIKAVGLSHSVPALLGPPPNNLVAPQYFQNTPVITHFNEVKHNNGPNAADVLVRWHVNLDEDDARFNWVARDNDDRCFNNGDEVPCMEGNPEDGDNYDNCYDGEDNDGDDDIDGEDSDCRQYIDEIEFVIRLEPSVQTLVQRSIIVSCKNLGPFGFGVQTEQDPINAFDPQPNNNDRSDSVPNTGQGDPVQCAQLTKGPPFAGSDGDANRLNGPPPAPYFPVALPNTGGPPVPRD